MKLFITGASGFIGNYLLEQLSQTEHELYCLVRSSSRYENIQELGHHLIFGDISNKNTLIEGMRGCDVVIHLANLYTFWDTDMSLLEKVNVVGTRNAMEAAMENGVKKFVHVSTYALYENPAEVPFTEQTAYDPPVSSEYTRTKYAGEHAAWDFFKNYGLPLVVVSPANVIGSGDHKATGQYFDNFVKGKLPARIFEETIQTFVFVEDVADAIIKAVEKNDNIGEKYLIGKEQFSFAEMNKLLSEISGKKEPLIKLPKFLAYYLACILTFFADIIGKPPLWGMSRDQIRTARNSFCCNGKKAEGELGIHYTPVQEVLERIYTPNNEC